MIMNAFFQSMVGLMLRSSAVVGLGLVLTCSAQEGELSAKALAEKMSAAVLDNASSVRLKLEFTPAKGGEKVVLQLQANASRTAAASDILYKVLWPKERKGEGFVLRKASNQAATGSVLTLPDQVTPLTGGGMKEGIFGSALSYEDLVGNFFGWVSQEIVGTEVVNRVTCQILESKPGKGDYSSYAIVRSWIDTKRLVPIRIEKFGGGGAMVSRIVTTRVAKDDTNRQVPASFTVQRAGEEAVTVIEGSNSKHDVTFTAADFSIEALKAP
jgi:hypothetical protein